MSGLATIGRVTAVNSREVRVQLDDASMGFTKVGPDGLVTVAVVNSYITIPAGPHRVVAIVTGVSIAGRGHPAAGVNSAFLPIADAGSYELVATIVGRFEDSKFQSGLTGYPPLGAPVAVAAPDEVRQIFLPQDARGIRIGTSAAASEQAVHLSANLLLGHHCAVVGSTGSGKSCTVTAIIDALLDEDIPGGHIILFDINGEYAQSFGRATHRGRRTRTVVLGPEPGPASGLFLPHWFMNNDEHMTLLRAQEGVQAPVLQRAIADARIATDTPRTDVIALRSVATTLEILGVACEEKWGLSQAASQKASLERLLGNLAATAGPLQATWLDVQRHVAQMPKLNAVQYQAVGADDRQTIQVEIEAIRPILTAALNALGLGSGAAAADFDAPVFYSLQELCDLFLPARIRREQAADSKVANYVATLQMRLSRLLADGRYDFMTRVENHEDPVGSYLRMLMGEDPTHGKAASDWPGTANHWEYLSPDGVGPSVTIFDLSLVASDVLANITALLGRLVFDFALRMEPRAEYPILLVLEEAHRFVPARSDTGAERSAAVFERIAKEGRKFGLSLLLASQRPSELSETVVAQCGTVIAHRLTHEADQALLRHATALSSRALLDQLPGLAQQHALITGVSTGVPVAVRVRDVEDPPRSKDPDFMGRWAVRDSARLSQQIDVLAARWQRTGH